MSGQNRNDELGISLDDIKDKVKSSLHDISRNLKKSQLEAQLRDTYRELGEAVFVEHSKQPFLPIAFSGQLSRILSLQKSIDATQHDPSEVICSGCHQAIPDNAKFCPVCGARIV